MRLRIYASAAWCFIAVSAVAQQPTAISVGVLTAERKPVTRATEFVGRIEAMARVEIRARVTGFIEDVLFKEGDVVKEGDPLYKIEPGTFEAAVQQARGALLDAQAKFANASAQ
jgi:membrane fusion protein (multidrug efflux system)